MLKLHITNYILYCIPKRGTFKENKKAEVKMEDVFKSR